VDASRASHQPQFAIVYVLELCNKELADMEIDSQVEYMDLAVSNNCQSSSQVRTYKSKSQRQRMGRFAPNSLPPAHYSIVLAEQTELIPWVET
jgi:hypothetical protein